MPILRRIAGVQSHVSFGQNRENLARMEAWLARPELQDADLVVFPECMLSGYCFQSFEEAWPCAETLTGSSIQHMERVCQQRNRTIVFGLLERGEQNEIYNTCVMITPNGLHAAYRKTHLPGLGVDRFVTAGTNPFSIVEWHGMRLGLHICYDASFPEACRALTLAGADLLVLPTNWPPGATNFAKYLPNARAFENTVYFLAVNRVGTERGFRFIGQSRLCDVLGNTLQEVADESEAIFCGEIDLELARHKRQSFANNQHVVDRIADRRPDLYHALTVPHPRPTN